LPLHATANDVGRGRRPGHTPGVRRLNAPCS
jgi:hypothetical protein